MGSTTPRADAPARRVVPSMWMYHSVSPSTAPDPHLLRVHPRRFGRQLRTLARLGIRGVPLREALTRGDRRTVALTFDDGYGDFISEVMPALARYGMTASVYVVAGRIAGTNDWDANSPQVPLMTADEVRAAAAAGHEVGSHSLTHPHLSGSDPETLRREVADSRRVLEELLDAPVEGFAFPYGEHDVAAVDAVRDAGYRYACVTGDYGHQDVHRLPRYYVGQRDGALRLLAKETRHYLRRRQAQR
jgi:peptidoglycan/xylan/chitin deacetylase (PgdA/CDA1 family)